MREEAGEIEIVNVKGLKEYGEVLDVSLRVKGLHQMGCIRGCVITNLSLDGHRK